MARKVFQPTEALDVLRSLELWSLLAEKKRACELICACVIQQRWSVPSSVFVNFLCSCDLSLQCIIYVSFFYSFFN